MCKIASIGSNVSTYVVMYPVHASNFPRTASFVRNAPGEITSEHFIAIVFPNPIGGFGFLS